MTKEILGALCRRRTTLVFLLLLCICLFSVWDSHDTHDIFFFCFIYSSVLLASTTTALLRRAIHSLHTCGTKCVQENRQNDWLGCCFGESRAVEGKKTISFTKLAPSDDTVASKVACSSLTGSRVSRLRSNENSHNTNTVGWVLL